MRNNFLITQLNNAYKIPQLSFKSLKCELDLFLGMSRIEDDVSRGMDIYIDMDWIQFHGKN